MGNDGGSIPTRRELVKEAARNQTVSEVKELQQERLEYRWSTCPLSLRKLQEPVVSDAAGILYNKDAIIELLLPHELSKEELAVRVSSMKDVVEVLFEEGWICPVTRKPLATTRAVYIVPCGHAFAESAVREIADTLCPTCSTSFLGDDIVSIFSSDGGAARLQNLKDRGVTHSLKGKKKRKKESEKGNGNVKGGDKGTNGSLKEGQGNVKNGNADGDADSKKLGAPNSANSVHSSKKRKL